MDATNLETQPPVSLAKWTNGAGITPVTAWRLRKRGWLVTINIAGRQYVSAEAAAEFNRRAAAGEFSLKHPVPVRGNKPKSATRSV